MSRYYDDLLAVDSSENSLEHFGIRGMKWGVQNGPPYPLSSKISTGRTLRSAMKSKSKSATKPETAEEHEAKRKAAILSGDPDEVMKYQKELSIQELNDAIRRVQVNQQLNKASKEAADGRNKVKKAMKIASGVAIGTASAVGVYYRLKGSQNEGLPGVAKDFKGAVKVVGAAFDKVMGEPAARKAAANTAVALLRKG